ncbi:putative membrane protein [Pelomonas saccharophila]|uniref:Membrane protein n=1 Tax=Roseateles saccharophilus TaxID=304 RepID=A0ABU1YL59_ROSSA|nr:TPM domain-containing protein [Roseateles saccharophilus]MDR7269595.1 putative membrane protein [Roseateles saccharophilus]
MASLSSLKRLIRHRMWDDDDAHRVLPAEALARLQQRVADSERRHSGEIRICVEAGLPLSYLWRDAPVRERALAMFAKLGVWDTEHNNGVLIYLLLAEHRIEIVADRALARRVDAGLWQQLVDTMGDAFRAGRFEPGLNDAIAAVDALLAAHFPHDAGDATRRLNELPDAPLLTRRRDL